MPTAPLVRRPKYLSLFGEKIQKNTWPGLLISLYDGTKTPDQFRTAALGEPATEPERVCEIDFYLGEFEEFHSSTDKARKLLADAVHECPQHNLNHFAAKADLDLLATR